jgi:hypothetical protein
MDVHWLGTIAGVEEETVGAAAENGRHGDSEMGCGQSNPPASSPIIGGVPIVADCRSRPDPSEAMAIAMMNSLRRSMRSLLALNESPPRVRSFGSRTT